MRITGEENLRGARSAPRYCQVKARRACHQDRGTYFERLQRGDLAPSREAAPQRLVNNVPEGMAGALGFLPDFPGEIVVQCERRSHALMLNGKRQDFNA
jgi:hypothetical protein